MSDSDNPLGAKSKEQKLPKSLRYISVGIPGLRLYRRSHIAAPTFWSGPRTSWQWPTPLPAERRFFASSRSWRADGLLTGVCKQRRIVGGPHRVHGQLRRDLPGQGYSAGIHRRIVHPLDVDIGQQSRIVAAGHDLKALAAQARPQRIGNLAVKTRLAATRRRRSRLGPWSARSGQARVHG